MLRGRFEREELNEVHQYYCVIKSASQAEGGTPHPDFVEAMRREQSIYIHAQRQAGRNPTGCVRLYAAHPQHHYLVLEDHGADLRALLTSSLKFPQQVLEAIVSAVHALHSLGIMHGDIKPQNLLYKLFDHGYVVKLCDLDAAYKVGETCRAVELGSQHYHAPELRAAADRGDTIKAALELDMFPLGLVMWQVLMRSPHAALDCAEEDALYTSQDNLNEHLSYRAPYREVLQKVTSLSPAQRMKIADLSRDIKTLSASNAQQGWLQEREENRHLKRVVGDQLGTIHEKLDKMDAKLDRVLQELRTRFDALGSSAVAVAESQRREAILGREQEQVLPAIMQAAQDALHRLSSSAQGHTPATSELQECMSSMQGSIEAAISRAVAGQKAALSVEFSALANQMHARFADLSADLQTHLREQRQNHAQSDHQMKVLSHTNECLKAGLGDVLRSLSAVRAELHELKENQTRLGKKLVEVLEGNAEITSMVRVLAVNTCGLPTLAVILPVVSTSWKSKLNPMTLVRDQFRLYFLCSHTQQLAPCGPKGKGKGYKITVTKQWVLDAAPVLRVGLVLLKVALVASGLPLPVPDLCSMLVGNAMHSQYLDAALQLVSNPPDGSPNSSELVMKQTLDAIHQHDISDLLDAQKLKGAGAEIQLQEGSRKAYETIKEILGKDGVNIPLTCGLRQVTHRGKTAWVLDNDATMQDWMSAVDKAAP
jgi:serine/threonine protein kinase